MTRDKTARFVAVLIAFCVCFTYAATFDFSVKAVSVNDAHNRTKEAESKFNAAKDKQADAKSKLQEMDTLLTNISTDIYNKELKILDLETQIEEKNLSIEAKTQELNEKSALFDQRVQFIYEEGSSSYLEILFSAESLTDFFNRYEIIGQLVEYDKEIIDGIAQVKQALEDEKAAVESAKAQRETELTALQSKQDEYEVEQANREAYYNQMTADVAEYERLYNEAKSQEEALRMQVASSASKASSGTAFVPSGMFNWPIPGHYRITSAYGYRLHPTLKVYKLHTGTDVSAPNGTPVYAAAAGKVIMAGYNTGYGNYVVIDHGNGVSTLYAHASSLCVSKGQSVTTSTQVIKVGSTGYSTGNHLHFEVMLNGATTNPMQYFN